MIKRGTPFDELKSDSLTNYRLLADDDRSPHWLNGYRTLPLETRAERCEYKSGLRYKRTWRATIGGCNQPYPCSVISTGTRWHRTPGLIRSTRKIRVRIQSKHTKPSVLGWLFADVCCGAGDGDCKEPPRNGLNGMCEWCFTHWTQELETFSNEN